MYLILKDFKGSQDGRFSTQFYKDDEVELSKELAGVAIENDWAKQLSESEASDEPKEGSKPWIISQLTELEVEFNKSASKPDLEKLLEKALES